MFNTSKSFTDNIKRYSWLLVLPLIVGFFLSSCGDSPINAQTDFTDSSSTSVNNDITFVPEQFDAVGTIQGTVIDKATGEALSEVAVSLNFMPEEADEPSVLTDSTGSEGTFAFTGVPVNSSRTDANGSNFENSPYNLKISAEELDNYRDLYRFNAPLTFEPTGGDGAATNLVSNVTIPLSELAVTLKGKAHTMADAILSDVRVELYQSFNPIINGSSDTQTDMLVDSATTGSDGSFSFEGVEEKAEVMLRFVDDSDPSEVINYEPGGSIETPAGDGATPEVNLGVINVSSSNESGAFYLTSVTPEPDSDVETDTVFKYVFNRPVAENAYTNADAGFGTNTMNDDIEFDRISGKSLKAPGDVEFSVSFGETRDSLIIDPDESTMEDASEYELLIDAFDDPRFVDEFGNMLSYGASDFDDGVEELTFFTGDNKNAPHTPSITLTQNASDTVEWNGGSADLTWNIDNSSAQVNRYEVFVSRNGGAYKHFMTETDDEGSFGEFTFTIDGVTSSSGAGDFDNPNPDSDFFNDLTVTDENSGQAVSYDIKVRAISTNLVAGDFSNVVTFEDEKMPDVTNVVRGINDDDNHLYVEFSEPMDESTAETVGNYAILDGGGSSIDADITAATYNRDEIDDPNGAVGYDLRLTVASGDLDSGVDLQVQSAVTDLAGNAMSNDNNSVTY